MKTATFIPIKIIVMSIGWRADQNLARVFTSGRLAFAHARQWLPTVAWTRQSSHAGLPQRVHRRPAGRPVCR
jgi:hypothetical protein